MSDSTPDLSTPLGRYEMMLTIRLFEQKIEELFDEGLIHGTAHLCIGQEAAAVGAVSASRPTDPIVSSHRGHGHFLARCADPAALMAEMLGKVSGPCMGRGGSQHLCAHDLAFYCTNGITGGGIPTATGLGLSEKADGTDRAVLCFFGDGASNQGTFHESLNMAAIWDLPVVYLCENNLYAMSTPVKESMGVLRVAERAGSYGMPGRTVDGMDIEAVREASSEALERARAGEGPSLVEARTYRFCGHSKSDRLVYRTRAEEECWEAVDPLVVERKALESTGTPEEELERVEERCRHLIEDAYAQAERAPAPTREQVIVSPYWQQESEQA
jgi:TPP-dependent pyruvate/acetoin dehydrogenase alpha subunit